MAAASEVFVVQLKGVQKLFQRFKVKDETGMKYVVPELSNKYFFTLGMSFKCKFSKC